MSVIGNMTGLILSANHVSVFLLQLLCVPVRIDSTQLWFGMSVMSIVAFLVLIVEMRLILNI